MAWCRQDTSHYLNYVYTDLFRHVAPLSIDLELFQNINDLFSTCSGRSEKVLELIIAESNYVSGQTIKTRHYLLIWFTMGTLDSAQWVELASSRPIFLDKDDISLVIKCLLQFLQPNEPVNNQRPTARPYNVTSLTEQDLLLYSVYSGISNTSGMVYKHK